MMHKLICKNHILILFLLGLTLSSLANDIKKDSLEILTETFRSQIDQTKHQFSKKINQLSSNDQLVSLAYATSGKIAFICNSFYKQLHEYRNKKIQLQPNTYKSLDTIILGIQDQFPIYISEIESEIKKKYPAITIYPETKELFYELSENINNAEHQWHIDQIISLRNGNVKKDQLPTCDGALKQIYFDELSKQSQSKNK